MYEIVLMIHSYTRWLVLLAGVATVGLTIYGWLAHKSWSQLHNRLSLIFTIALDVQVAIGLLLYFISPLVQMAFSDFGAAMKNSELRFFAVEHIFTMVVALALAHVGRVLAKRGKTDTLKLRNAAILFTLSLLAILSAIPWGRLRF